MFTRFGHRSGSLFAASALLVGGAIGAGIFGLPYVFSKSGFGIGLLYLLTLGLLTMLVNLAYGEVVLSTKGTHQFPKYVEKYLGGRWKLLAMIALFVGLYGSLAAYVVEIGNLLHELFYPYLGGSSLIYSLVFAGFVSMALLIGLRAVAATEKIMVWVMFILTGLLIVIGLPSVETNHLTTIDPTYAFLPFGVVLFALGAASAIPDMKNILVNNKKALFKAILIGSIIPIIVYAIFSFVVIGVTGPNTTESAVIGLGTVLGKPALLFGAIFGIVAMSTSFLMLGMVIKEVFQYDFKVNQYVAWALVMLPPVAIVAGHWLSFIEILGISGALIGGIDGIIIMHMHRKLPQHRERTPEYTISRSITLHAFTYVIFVLGICYEFYIVGQRLHIL